jgi:DNA-binding transcriptional regulator YiaG
LLISELVSPLIAAVPANFDVEAFEFVCIVVTLSPFPRFLALAEANFGLTLAFVSGIFDHCVCCAFGFHAHVLRTKYALRIYACQYINALYLLFTAHHIDKAKVSRLDIGAMQITAELLRIVRNDLGESQAEFARHFGCDQTTIHRWETDGPPQSGITAMMLELVLPNLIAVRPPDGPPLPTASGEAA